MTTLYKILTSWHGIAKKHNQVRAKPAYSPISSSSHSDSVALSDSPDLKLYKERFYACYN